MFYNEDPTQEPLFKVVVKYIHEGKYLELGIALLILYFPIFAAIFARWLNHRKVVKLYESRLRDKDREIERLAQMVKDFHNLNLKTKRK